MPARARHLLLAVAAGLALADASIVTLALPELLHELDTSVEGVASVLGVYTVVLAMALVPAERLQRRAGPQVVGAAGLVVFALASVVCGAAPGLGVLLAGRAVQAIGGATALVAAFALLEPHGADRAHARRLWLGAAVLAGAAGPALGGALTELLSWEAIFYAQAPIAAVAAWAAWTEPLRPPAAAPTPPAPSTVALPTGPAVALALVSAALTAVLFLLVLLLVAGWDVSPLGAALTVTAIPAAALLGSRLGGDARTRAAAGCVLVGAGVLALAFLPGASPWWTVPPQVAAGLGMGLALPALGGDLLPERTPHEAARLLVLRHAGIALALALLAPIVSSDLAAAIDRARERGVAVVLDARLPPLDKLRLAPDLLAGVEDDQPRAGLRAALAEHEDDADDAEAYAALADGVDDTLVVAVGEAFRTAFLATGVLALLAAVAVVPAAGRRAPALAAAATLALPVAYLGLHAAVAPEPAAIADPCEARELPGTGGIFGAVQDRVLAELDAAACRYGSSREQLLLALVDDDDRRAFIEEHGEDPRTLGALLDVLLG